VFTDHDFGLRVLVVGCDCEWAPQVPALAEKDQEADLVPTLRLMNPEAARSEQRSTPWSRP